METKKVLVIGAGVAGLAAIKACKEEKLDVVCYEKSGHYGGLWLYKESEDEPSVMKNTVSNTSKEMSAFTDFPPPSQSPTYLPHADVVKYLELYAEHFDLLGCINYYQEVLEVIPSEDYDSTGKLLVKVKDLRTNESREETFAGVMACTGHHNIPDIPTYPNMDLYKGKIMHSSNYKYFGGLENKVVLVVGAGNSGGDIAAESSSVAKKVYLSTRRGAWIFPRMLEKGKPMDIVFNRRYKNLLPANYVAKNVEKTINKRMDHKRFGIKPHHPVFSQHPTINDEIQVKIFTGFVCIKGNIKEFSPDGVRFDGEEEITPVDVVIFATGFLFKVPYLAEDIVRVGKNNKVHLYENVFPPQLKHHTLGIIGLIQPTGSLFPVFEMQSRWFASLMTGKCHLPSSDKMLAKVRKVEDLRARTYVQSARHAVEVHWATYMDDIAQKIGAKPNFAQLFFKDPKLFYACYFGPCLPYQYRLKGPHKWGEARQAILNYKNRLYEHLDRNKSH